LEAKIMGLRGEAAVVIWGEMTEDAAEVDLWYAREHLQERLNIPGFLRARRCVRELGSPSYFMIYELSYTSVPTSPAYLERLNNPTPWTKQIMAKARSGNRTLCKTVASHGLGIGAYLMTARVETLDGPGSELSAWMTGSLASIAEQPGITGAHLLHRDTSVVRPDTKERQARQRADGSSDVVALIEGYDPNAVGAVAKKFPATAKSVVQIDLYQVAQAACAEDVR
jgi:hypothetical protein